MAKRKVILLDTNVWLDHFIPNRAKGELVDKLLEKAVESDVELVYALRSLHDVYWNVMAENKEWVRSSLGSLPENFAKAARDAAWGCLDIMLELGTPVGADLSDVWYARQMRNVHPDFEDDMVLAAAERAHADYLVSSDAQLIAKASVPALSPEDMLAYLEIWDSED